MRIVTIGRRKSARRALLLGSAFAFGMAGSVQAQEVVQPLPPAAAGDLNDALGRLARNADDADAMLDAGEAALALGDVDAAIGFFGRARQRSPNNTRVSLGMARAYVASRRPVEALRFFAEAEQAGVSQQRMAADRGLAFDLVGDSASAQSLYRLAIAGGAGGDVVRQLALSQAISGDRKGFEATLLPLLQQGDNAAFRTRAFGLAVLGDTDAAVKIARDMMAPRMAARIEPYLKFMTQLTPAQQAAAGNLGVFPSTGSIGQDEPALAKARVQAAPTAVGSPDRALAPTGPVMGSERAQAARRDTSEELPPVSTSQPSLQVAAGQSTAPPLPQSSTTPATPPLPPSPPPPQSPVSAAEATPAPPVRIVSAPPPDPAPAPPPESVAQAFAGFDLADRPQSRTAQGAVDITRIDVPREVKAPPPPPPPPPPPVPSRAWVQVATGKDRAALKFDWRRISRKAEGALDGKGPFVTEWGEANRLLAGPYPSAKAAQDMVSQLKAIGIDSFSFTSAKGEVIDPLK